VAACARSLSGNLRLKRFGTTNQKNWEKNNQSWVQRDFGDFVTILCQVVGVGEQAGHGDWAAPSAVEGVGVVC